VRTVSLLNHHLPTTDKGYAKGNTVDLAMKKAKSNHSTGHIKGLSSTALQLQDLGKPLYKSTGIWNLESSCKINFDYDYSIIL
jgi:hypothetical protein